MALETAAEPQLWPADELVSELSVAARAMGIDEPALAAALSRGQTMSQVARANGVKEHQVVRALVSSVVASVADEIRSGDLNADQVTWLVYLATWRAEQQVTTAFPAIEFRPDAAVQGTLPRDRGDLSVRGNLSGHSAGRSPQSGKIGPCSRGHSRNFSAGSEGIRVARDPGLHCGSPPPVSASLSGSRQAPRSGSNTPKSVPNSQ